MTRYDGCRGRDGSRTDGLVLPLTGLLGFLDWWWQLVISQYWWWREKWVSFPWWLLPSMMALWGPDLKQDQSWGHSHSCRVQDPWLSLLRYEGRWWLRLWMWRFNLPGMMVPVLSSGCLVASARLACLPCRWCHSLYEIGTYRKGWRKFYKWIKMRNYGWSCF